MKSAVTSPAPVVAAAVSRVSLAVQTSNYSIESQHHKIQDLCAKHNLIVSPEHLLDDQGYSGRNFARPAFRKLLQLVKEGKVQAALFPYTDRFARCVEPALAMIR
jgi:DNA invertase Pin-like site-specific DNA recombinase